MWQKARPYCVVLPGKRSGIKLRPGFSPVSGSQQDQVLLLGSDISDLSMI